MFSIPGTLVLIVLTYVRPQTFIPQLQGAPILHLTYVATFLGLIVDLRLRYLRLQRTPLLVPAGLFMFWCIATAAIKAPSTVGGIISEIFIVVMLFSCIAFSAQTFKGVRTLARGLVLVGIFLSIIAIHQRLAPEGCVRFKLAGAGEFDGRSCETVADCIVDKEPGLGYACEHIGLFNSYALSGRVRWIGVIQDPNELAMCISVCVPLLIALYLLGPTRRRLAGLLIGGGLIILAVIYTQSRGGQLVFLAAIGVYFVRRYGVRGAMVGLVLAMPLLLLGGRSGAEADESKMERLEALYIAMTLMVSYPLTGVGYRQFTEYNVLTAHNSYALSVAELGFPGLFLFATLLYLAGKTSILALRRYGPDGPARAAHIWAGSLIATQAGFMIGIFLLSFNLHPVLWIFFAMNTAFYAAVKRHDPTFEVRFGWVDFARVGAFVLVISTFMFTYSRMKVGGQ
jgi:hypothetical protein